MVDKSETKSLLELIIGLYPNVKLSKETAAIWAECLKDVSYEQARSNLIKHVKTSSFAPVIADILNPDGVRKKKTDDICETTCSPYELYFPEGKPN